MESATLQKYLHLSFCAPSSQVKLGRLLKRFGSLNSLLSELKIHTPRSLLDKVLLEWSQQGDHCAKCQPAIEKALNWQDQPANTILCYEDPDYPTLLKEIDDPPAVLYVQGNISLLSSPQIAIIGSRQASIYGKGNAFWLGEELNNLGITVTSGMAAGIDSKAHEGALHSKGNTIAVVGTGIDGCYPPGNRKLKQQLAANGALVSEFPLGSLPLSFHFPQRNRIISGLSLGVVVIEAAIKSGSLITARLAMEQNREVFALPGLITNPKAQGCHRLINEGVKLVQTIDDIVQEIGVSLNLATENAPKAVRNEISSKVERLILNVLTAAPATLDYLLASTTVPEDELIGSLSTLEAQSVIKFSHGRYNYLGRA